MISELDHIGIAVYRLEDVLHVYRDLLGIELQNLRISEDHKIKAALLKLGNTNIELIEPLRGEGPITKFLKKRGQGIHHIAFKADNVEMMIDQLKEKGVELIDKKPRKGIEGGKIAFLHPRSTGHVLIELCEH